MLNCAQAPESLFAQAQVRCAGTGDAAGAAPLRAHAQSMDLRTYGIGAQILRDLGISRMRVLSAPKQMNALSGCGLEVVEYVAA